MRQKKNLLGQKIDINVNFKRKIFRNLTCFFPSRIRLTYLFQVPFWECNKFIVYSVRNNLQVAGSSSEVFDALNCVEKEILSLKVKNSSNEKNITDIFQGEVFFRIRCTACNDKSAAHWHCKDCKKNICNACQKAHLRVKITKNHSLTFLNK